MAAYLSSILAPLRFQALTSQLWVWSTYFSLAMCLTPTRTPSLVKTTFCFSIRCEAASLTWMTDSQMCQATMPKPMITTKKMRSGMSWLQDERQC